MQPLSFFSRPGGQALLCPGMARVPLAAPMLAVPLVLPELPMLMLVVFSLLALLPAVLPLPLLASLLLMLPLGVEVLPADV